MQLRFLKAVATAFQPSPLARQRKAEGLCLSCGGKTQHRGDLACAECAAKSMEYH